MRHKILVTYASAVCGARSVEINAEREVGKVQEQFARLESRSFDISSETDVRDLVAVKKIVNLQLERSKRFPAIVEQLTPYSTKVAMLTTLAVTEHFNTILRQIIKRVGASCDSRPMAAEAAVIVAPMRGDALKLRDETRELLAPCHVKLVEEKISFASTLSKMTLFLCGSTQASAENLVGIGGIDAIEASVKSLFQGLDNTEADNFLQLYKQSVQGTKDASVATLKSLILRHCECDEKAALTTPVAIARAVAEEVNKVLKVLGRVNEEGISCDLVVKIALLNEMVHQRRRATAASVNDMLTCLEATKSLATEEALSKMSLSDEDRKVVFVFLDRVQSSVDELKQTVSQHKPKLKAYAEVAETMDKHPLPDSVDESVAWIEFMTQGGGTKIVAALDKLKAEVASK